jgi:mono/diheme cytochrome c family protein
MRLRYTPGVPIITPLREGKSGMTFVRLALLVIISSLFAVACSKPDNANTNQTRPAGAGSPSTASNTPADEFATARANYKNHCTTCHGNDGSGGPVKLDDGTKLKVPSLREGHALKHKDEEFVKQITSGGDGMPKFGDKLSREETIDLVRFIRKEFQSR